MYYLFTTPDHPAASGRTPADGDEGFVAIFPTDEGGEVRIQIGREGLVLHAAILLAAMRDDARLYCEILQAIRTVTNEKLDLT